MSATKAKGSTPPRVDPLRSTITTNARSLAPPPVLLPCAHCGGVAKLALMPGTRAWWRVQCADFRCGTSQWATRTDPSVEGRPPGPERAIAAWNRRTVLE